MLGQNMFLQPYLVKRRIGQGSLGAVYEAIDQHCTVALKQMSLQGSSPGNHISVKQWNGATVVEHRDLSCILQGHTDAVKRVAFSTGGQIVASSS